MRDDRYGFNARDPTTKRPCGLCCAGPRRVKLGPLALSGALRLHVALGAISLRFEGGTAGVMTRSTRSLVHFSGFVQAGFVVQGRFRVLLEQFVVAGAAIAISAF